MHVCSVHPNLFAFEVRVDSVEEAGAVRVCQVHHALVLALLLQVLGPWMQFKIRDVNSILAQFLS